MPLELECPQCHIRLAVETGGVTIQCPGCEAFLEVPAFDGTEPQIQAPASRGPRPKPIVSQPIPSGEDTEEVEPGTKPWDWDSSTVVDHSQLERSDEPERMRITPAADDPTEVVSLDHSSGLLAHKELGGVDEVLSKIRLSHSSQDDTEILPALPKPSVAETPRPIVPAKLETIRKPAAGSNRASIAAAMSSSNRTTGLATRSPPESRISTPVLLLASYACAVTVAFLYLLYQVGFGGGASSQLESLPDLAPPVDKKGNQITLQIVPGNAPMPRGHTLTLGKSQRFGDVLITPLRVTRGSLKFRHYSGKAEFKRDPTSAVLAMHVRWKNVSTSQSFTPLDAALLYSRRGGDAASKAAAPPANNIVFLERNKTGKLNPLTMYDLEIDGEWDFEGQNLGKVLKPGESTEMYIPAGEEPPFELDGNLLWRLHFRKGHNHKSGRGVTTLVEVAFHSDDIKGD